MAQQGYGGYNNSNEQQVPVSRPRLSKKQHIRPMPITPVDTSFDINALFPQHPNGLNQSPQTQLNQQPHHNPPSGHQHQNFNHQQQNHVQPSFPQASLPPFQSNPNLNHNNNNNNTLANSSQNMNFYNGGFGSNEANLNNSPPVFESIPGLASAGSIGSGGTINSSRSSGGRGADAYANEPPLLEELGIDFPFILRKTSAILKFYRPVEPELAKDSDLGGPLVFCLLLGPQHKSLPLFFFLFFV